MNKPAAGLASKGMLADPGDHFTGRFEVERKYAASDPAATSVLERVVALTGAYPGIVKKSKLGERDPISEWFAAEHSFGEFRHRGRELIERIADKLET